ncbi:IS3 family transposase [Alkalibacillus haloalkaliphilus]|uniref:IS3 family transposase n=1 Tax=Alkalibacillus haloalkaliphilus TaxID=94136 RepID=UPI0029365886|nr:IS3 family transposase [Alkalibacillus haloalkaliphilus]MDV2583509.1 IS3 family transposase [Alkalibacillus haloalkaliphilus]
MEAHTGEHTVKKMCQVLGVSTSGYYRYIKRKVDGPSDRDKYNKKLDEAIKKHYYDHLEAYGSPKMHQLLVRDGFIISGKTVANRMRAMNLYAQGKSFWVTTTDSNHCQPIYENKLKRKFDVDEPNTSWVTDITYIHILEGFLYLNPVMDLFSRKIISYTIDESMTKELCIKALNHALETRKPKEGFIHHSDRGSQYSSSEYTDILKQTGAEISMSKKGDPFDNACIESFFASLKKEYLYRWIFRTKEEAIAAIQFYIEFYNRKRIHSTIGYMTPNEYEQAHQLDNTDVVCEDNMALA